MENFEKDKIDVSYYFPDLIDIDNIPKSEKWFDTYMEASKKMLDKDDKKSYTKDNISYAFLMGASTAQRLILNYYANKLESLKDYQKVKKYVEDFLKRTET